MIPAVLEMFVMFAVAVVPEPGPLPSSSEVVMEATPEAVKVVLVEAFAAALEGDFERYAVLVHASEKSTPEQRTQLERFTFGRFVRQAVWYLQDGKDAASFVVERIEDLGGDKIRYYLKDVQHASRPSVPVTLGTAGGKVVILSNSL